MNIGIDIRSFMQYPRTGVGEYIAGFAEALLRHHPEHRYIFFTNGWKTANAVVPRGWQSTLLTTRIPNLLLQAAIVASGYPKLDQVIARRTAPLDVFFSPNLNAVGISSKTRFVLTVHDLSFALFPQYFSKKHRLWHRLIDPERQMRRADAILVPSEHTKRDIVSYYGIGEEKIRVAYPGLPAMMHAGSSVVSQESLQKKYGLTGKFLLFLGTIEERKNVDGLIEAFLFWKKIDPAAAPYALVLAGALGFRGKKILERVKNVPSIRYLGYIKEEDRLPLYGSASLFAYPSFYEGFGFPVLEAMSAGIPVVTSNRTSLIEIADDAAYLVNPYNIAEIADGFHQILGDDWLRRRCIERGLMRVAAFSWQSAADVFFHV